MTNEHDTDTEADHSGITLDLATDDQIAEELSRRHRAVIVTVCRDGDDANEPTESQSSMYANGETFLIRGLIEITRERIIEKIDEERWFRLADDEFDEDDDESLIDDDGV